MSGGDEYRGLIGPVARQLLDEPNAKLSKPNDLRFGTKGSLSVNLDKDSWYDHETGEGGGVLDLVSRHTGRPDGRQWLIENGHLQQAIPPRSPSPAAEYDYADEYSELQFQVVKTSDGRFFQRQPDGSGGWVNNLKGVKLVPYRLPELKAKPDAAVYIVEGEKDVDNLRAVGLLATCNAGGAGKWRDEYSEHLRGRDVVVVPDNDVPGRKHRDQVVQSLGGVAKSMRVLELPGLDEKGDVSDWLAAGGTADELMAMLPAVQPDQAHASAETGVIDGADLLRDVFDYIGRFVAYPDNEAHVGHTLWIAHTHMMDAWDSTPRLAVLSPEPGSGKSRVLEVTELLVPRAVESVNVTPAYLFRKVGDEAGRPTILYDEIDTVFGPKAKDNEEIRGLLNSGHRKHSTAGRCVVRGKEVFTEEIPAYCAVALAGLGGLPDTIMTRSVVIRMRRRAPHEVVEPYRRRLNGPEAERLGERLALWAQQVEAEVTDVFPEMPVEVQDRDADVWEPLVAVADAAGDEWPELARATAVTAVTAKSDGGGSLGIQLLRDLQQIFGSADAMFTHIILDKLNNLDEAPWGDLRGKPLDSRSLSYRLKAYQIRPTTVRIGDELLKGYRREHLHDAWVRYLSPPSDTSVTSVTSVTSSAESGHAGESR